MLTAAVLSVAPACGIQGADASAAVPAPAVTTPATVPTSSSTPAPATTFAPTTTTSAPTTTTTSPWASLPVRPTVSPGDLRAAVVASAGRPVVAADFPDPFVLAADGRYYAYATSGSRALVQVARSDDLVSWTWVGSALLRPPSWARGRSVWAPAVLRRGSRFVMYYATREATSSRWCVSVAVADDPAGPFVDDSSEPWLCQHDHNGSIDPHPFVDADGTAYLLWQSQGIVGQEPTHLWAGRLADDGLSIVPGSLRRLLTTSAAWEGDLIENPAMVAADGRYFLLYSANNWQTEQYAIGAALCEGPLGPCRRTSGGPLLASSGTMFGPGGPAPVVGPDGATYLGFHAWDGFVGYRGGGKRALYLRPLLAAGGRLTLG